MAGSSSSSSSTWEEAEGEFYQVNRMRKKITPLIFAYNEKMSLHVCRKPFYPALGEAEAEEEEEGAAPPHWTTPVQPTTTLDPWTPSYTGGKTEQKHGKIE